MNSQNHYLVQIWMPKTFTSFKFLIICIHKIFLKISILSLSLLFLWKIKKFTKTTTHYFKFAQTFVNHVVNSLEDDVASNFDADGNKNDEVEYVIIADGNDDFLVTKLLFILRTQEMKEFQFQLNQPASRLKPL